VKPAANSTNPVRLAVANYQSKEDAAAVVALLDSYAHDPMGGSEGLSAYAKANVVAGLASRPQAFSILAWDGDTAVGLVNCIEGYSTFAAKPLVNVHDVAVLASHRGRGVGAAMLNLAEQMARERGACKMTLEVLSGNVGAARLYKNLGFAVYQLDPAMGQAEFYQKWLD
jgi:ribosomal protein S18 acetylase RimI-like enzyme